jgi:hypothetical protein
MERPDFIARLNEEIVAAANLRRAKQKADDPDERLRVELLALANECDPVKRLRKRAELCSHYRIAAKDIEQAIAQLQRRANTPKAKIYDSNDFFSLEVEAIDWTIPGMLPRGETAILAGMPKVGKSILAFDAAFAVATGEDPFLGENCAKGRVLLITPDASVRSVRSQLFKRGFRHGDDIRVMPEWDISQFDLLEQQLEDYRPTLVVVDSLKRITVGRDISENSAEFADNVYRLKEILQRYNASGLLIHHSNKDREAYGVGKVRGSTAIAGAVWGVWQLDHVLTAEGEGKNKRQTIDPSNPRRVLNVHSRDCEGQTMSVEVSQNLGFIRHESEGDREAQTHAERILALLAKSAPNGLEGCEIKEALPDIKNPYAALNRLVDRRQVGQRPSRLDRRRTVYYIEPTGTSNEIENDFKKTGDTPPPPLSVRSAIKSSQSLTLQGIQNRSQIDRTPQKIDHTLSGKTGGVSGENPDPTTDTEIDHTVAADKGGEGVEKISESQLAQSETVVPAEPTPKVVRDTAGICDRKGNQQTWKVTRRDGDTLKLYLPGIGEVKSVRMSAIAPDHLIW